MASCQHARAVAKLAGHMAASARRQAANFKQFEPEGLDLGEHAMQRGPIRQHTRQHGCARREPEPGA
jgi:hypothetical protein